MPSMDDRFAAPASPRLAALRDNCFVGEDRCFVNSLIPIALSSAWDGAFSETGFLAAPSGFAALPDLRAAFDKAARRISPPKEFYRLSVAERRVWLLREALLEHAPLEILPGDLLAGARCNLMLSQCLSKTETKSQSKLTNRKDGLLGALSAFRSEGRGCAGITGGGYMPDYPHLLSVGFQGIQAELKVQLDLLPKKERDCGRGVLLRSMMDACKIPVLLAERYAALCAALAQSEQDEVRKNELLRMADNLAVVPAGPAQDFYQAVQSLWLAHMTLMAEENAAGAQISLGRVDQYLLPYWQKSIRKGMDPALGRDIVGCLLLHCGSVRDAMTGYDGPACMAGEEQTLLLSGLQQETAGSACIDETSELTHVFLDVYGALSGLSGVVPLVALHRRSPEGLIERLGNVLSARPDAPLCVRFTAAGSSEADGQTATPFGPVGKWRAGEAFVQLSKAVELALTHGRGLDVGEDARHKRKRPGPDAEDAATFDSFEGFYAAFQEQMGILIEQAADLTNRATAIRSMFAPAPLASCLIPGCGDSMRDVTGGGAENSVLSIQAAGFATAVDSLLAIRYLTYEQNICTMDTLTAALAADWYGYELLQAAARYRAPKFGRDDPNADALAGRVAADFLMLVAQLPKTALGALPHPGFAETAGEMRPPFATPDGRNKWDLTCSGFTPGEPVPATALTNSVSALPSENGVLSVALPAWNLSHPEALARFKAFLLGAAGQNGLTLQLTCNEHDLPAEGEPDYDCVPVQEAEPV